MIDWVVFTVAGIAALAGALGVVLSTNPVHAALSLVGTLFSVAVLFVAQHAHFLAAVQVIVYAGAIVVLFLFVIMLLGIDQAEDLKPERLRFQRPLAVLAGAGVLFAVLLLARTQWVSGAPSVAGPLGDGSENVEVLAESLFTSYVLAFEVTSVLLVVAVVGAVVLVGRQSRPDQRDGLATDGGAAGGNEAQVHAGDDPEADPDAAPDADAEAKQAPTRGGQVQPEVGP